MSQIHSPQTQILFYLNHIHCIDIQAIIKTSCRINPQMKWSYSKRKVCNIKMIFLFQSAIVNTHFIPQKSILSDIEVVSLSVLKFVRRWHRIRNGSICNLVMRIYSSPKNLPYNLKTLLGSKYIAVISSLRFKQYLRCFCKYKFI